MPKYIVTMGSEYAGLAWNFQVNPSFCNNPEHYEQYLRLCAIGDQTGGRGTTHLFVDENEDSSLIKIMGFITLRAASLVKVYDDYNEGHAAIEIAELAVDMRYERCGIGSDLVKFAVVTASELNEKHIGIEYVTLCADQSAVGFYSRKELGFNKLEDYYKLPREGWNVNCTPMFLALANASCIK